MGYLVAVKPFGFGMDLKGVSLTRNEIDTQKDSPNDSEPMAG